VHEAKVALQATPKVETRFERAVQAAKGGLQ
jgi:DNA-directed RNA polymerase subunit K/omega